ncbi:MAG TPA: DUF2249 domain-containing protein [Methylomirabilota bacterium]|nr:DUF2249 domain-containing protein [Methylomirabilota bacterium]
MIPRDITVARLLEEHPELLEVLVRYHPHFAQLSNPALRRDMAPRVTVAQAARIAGVDPDELLGALSRALGEAPAPHSISPEGRGITGSPEGRGTVSSASPSEGEGADARPPALAAVPDSRQIHVDVREDIRRGQEPFGRIMATVKALGGDQVLVLRAPFEPVPLYDVLGRRGFRHWTECRAADDWSVWFYRDPGTAGAAPRAAGRGEAAAAGRMTTIDVRGLEPPEPMVRILEALERLTPDDTLEVLHERRPMFLYPQLDERGFTHETDEVEPGMVRIRIRAGGPAP